MGKQGDREKVEKLVGVLVDLHAKTGAVLDEINAVMQGKAGIGDKLKALEGAFAELWAERYRGGYAFNYAKDRPHLKRWLRTNTVEEITGRMANYMRSDDQFYVRARHNFAVFVSSFNNHAPAMPSGVTARGLERCVAEGKHEPPCQTEAEHTKRYQEEMRASGE